MKLVPMPQLETSRLILRKVEWADLDCYHLRLTSDPEVARAMLWDANPDLSQARETIRRIQAGYADGSRWHWAIAETQTNSLIGTIALLRFDPIQESCSFAYMLGKDFWAQGYATEAVVEVFRFAFEEMDVAVISADHFADNPASGRVMAKAGMTQGRILPRQYEKNGIWHDAVEYSITKEEWIRQG